jgi:hypothetical protein
MRDDDQAELSIHQPAVLVRFALNDVSSSSEQDPGAEVDAWQCCRVRSARSFFAALEHFTMHGKRGNHPYAFWLTVFCFVGGVLNTTLTSAYYVNYNVPILGPRSKASLGWAFGIAPDSPHTFNAALSSAVLGMALIVCLFRLWLFQGVLRDGYLHCRNGHGATVHASRLYSCFVFAICAQTAAIESCVASTG